MQRTFVHSPVWRDEAGMAVKSAFRRVGTVQGRRSVSRQSSVLSCLAKQAMLSKALHYAALRSVAWQAGFGIARIVQAVLSSPKPSLQTDEEAGIKPGLFCLCRSLLLLKSILNMI